LPNLRRNLLHWYTYRTVVGVVLGILLAWVTTLPLGAALAAGAYLMLWVAGIRG